MKSQFLTALHSSAQGLELHPGARWPGFKSQLLCLPALGHKCFVPISKVPQDSDLEINKFDGECSWGHPQGGERKEARGAEGRAELWHGPDKGHSQHHAGLSQMGRGSHCFAPCVLISHWLTLDGGVTLGQAAFFSEDGTQRGLTAESRSLRCSHSCRSSKSLIPEGGPGHAPQGTPWG